MLADGSNGSVELLDDHIVIRRKGLANILTQGMQGDKSIPFTSITAVQLRPAGTLMGGLIQFTIIGGREFLGGMLEATKDENAVIFDRKQEPNFLELRDAVQRAISRGVAINRGPGRIPADELAKLADLVEKGYLTRDEYDAQKNALLLQPAPLSSNAEPRASERAGSIRSRVDAMPDQAAVQAAKAPSKKWNLLLVAICLIGGALASLSYLGSSLRSEMAASAPSNLDREEAGSPLANQFEASEPEL